MVDVEFVQYQAVQTNSMTLEFTSSHACKFYEQSRRKLRALLRQQIIKRGCLILDGDGYSSYAVSGSGMMPLAASSSSCFKISALE